MPCKTCPLREKCASPCESLESLLPQPDDGRAHALHRSNARDYARQLYAQMVAARVATSHRHLLRGRQRQVFDLTYNELCTEAEAGRRLHITRRVAGRHLQRARRKIWQSLRKPAAER